MTTHLTSATQKIHVLVPELMELSFGTQISNVKEYPLFYVGYNNTQHALKLTMHGEESLLFVDKIRPDEIIGRTIELHHVLQAIAPAHMTRDIRYIARGKYLQIVEMDDDGKIVKSLSWVLSLPFHLQSEEVHKWVDEILP